MTIVIFHLLPPYLSQAPDIPLSSQQETVCLMVPDRTYPLVAGSEEFSLLVTTGKREQHECREGSYQKVKSLVMVTQKDPSPHSLGSMLGPHVFHCSLAWRGPRLLCLC